MGRWLMHVFWFDRTYFLSVYSSTSERKGFASRSLFFVKGELKAANALLATTSYFTKGVKDYKASRYDLELKDFEGVIEWINEYKPNPGGKLYVKDSKLILPGD